ncbi:MAG: DUF438 domain-containing protein, partial [Candidatus Humimicrobiaceae bacterium]
EDPKKVKDEFKEIIKDVSPTQIGQIEDELIKEGMPRDEITRLCDVHLEVFKESVEKEEGELEPSHPINILKEEHKAMLNISDLLSSKVEELKRKGSFDGSEKLMEKLADINKHFIESEKHYVREENVLFPYVEKHGIKEPPAIMWSEHNTIRDLKKGLNKIIEGYEDFGFKEFIKKLEEQSKNIGDMLSSHFYKENNILFKLSLDVMEEGQWPEIKRQFDEIGYCCFTPEEARGKPAEAEEKKTKLSEGKIDFDTGSLTVSELESVLNSLPVDITFVDKNDEVRYFNDPGERIFPRTKGVIGRTVQNCHPKESVQKVEEILNDFREGKRDSAVFWINMQGKLIYIRYYPVKNGEGEYLGTLEVTQNITDIQKLEGEKRLLD